MKLYVPIPVVGLAICVYGNSQIDWEASLNEGRVCVRYHVDPLLDDRKRIYDNLSIFLVRIIPFPPLDLKAGSALK